MTYEWDKRAARIQQSVRSGELERRSDYAESEVKQAIVNAREDIVMLVSYLSSANKQLYIIKWTSLAAVIVLLYIAYRLT
jgi:hypothetical protein